MIDCHCHGQGNVHVHVAFEVLNVACLPLVGNLGWCIIVERSMVQSGMVADNDVALYNNKPVCREPVSQREQLRRGLQGRFVSNHCSSSCLIPFSVHGTRLESHLHLPSDILSHSRDILYTCAIGQSYYYGFDMHCVRREITCIGTYSWLLSEV